MAKSIESDANDKGMVKRADTDSSGPSDTETVPSTTYLGRRSVPVISSCQKLMDAIERFRGDILFIAEIIRRSAIHFSTSQLILIKEILEASIVYNRYGSDQQFYDALIRFEESLEIRIEEESDFLGQQKALNFKIYEILRQSSFPYSARETACLDSFVEVLHETSGDPSSEGQTRIWMSIQELVRLLDLDDHLEDTTPYRVIIRGTIPFYFRNMLLKLEVLAMEEGSRIIPDFIDPVFTIELATYLLANFEVMCGKGKNLTPREHFHFGMVEIYTRFVEIFKKSGLDFSSVQLVAIQKIERRVRHLKKEPLMSKHHVIGEACLEFISELEENNPDREVTIEDGKVIWASMGKVNQAVNEIGWWLVNLQFATFEHLMNFPSFGNGIDNVIEKSMQRFLVLYPMH